MDNNEKYLESKWKEYSDIELIYCYSNCGTVKQDKEMEKELRVRGIDISFENLKKILSED